MISKHRLVLVTLSVMAAIFLCTGCSGGGGDGSSATKTSNNSQGNNQGNNSETFPALKWDGTQWLDVDWNQVTDGLSDLDKLAVRKQDVAKTDNAYFQVVNVGVNGYGVSIDELYVSYNDGVDWELALEPAAATPMISHIFSDGSTIFVVTFGFISTSSLSSSKLYQSDDEGDTWDIIMEKSDYGCGGRIGDGTYFEGTSDFFVSYPLCYGVTNLDTEAEGHFSNGTAIGSLVATDSLLYALTWGDVYQSQDGINWEMISEDTDIEELAVFSNTLYGFTE